MYGSDVIDMELRKLLLNILDDLSELDRLRLHFLLGIQVPRRLRELCTIETTLQIFEHLISTDKIFTTLIDALSACAKLEWSKRLKEFQQQYVRPMSHSRQESQTNCTLTQSVIADLTDEEEDSGTTSF